jgi:hypothetical protein
MGRILMIGGSTGYNSLYQLFHYSAPGVMDFSGTTPGYFSIDGGTSSINTFNTNTGGDFGDWAGKTVDAANAFATANAVMPFSGADVAAMDAIGWNSTSTPTLTTVLETQHTTA